MTKIDAVWIFSKAGIPIVDFCKQDSVNKALFGGAVSAIRTFTQEISGQNLKSFRLGEFDYTCTTCFNDKLILVLKSSKKAKNKHVQKICKVIKDMFENLYTNEEINNWDGNSEFFDKFKEKLEVYFKMASI
ncbi:MAG: hypothetical protein GF317_12175 [Candidatus Lokiarchaeota archaeon]|nr:hypothetical protein [Candidatus Lokiarchaeota archaeon]MBD3200404.1 hypothetical protein [Candidatus Lokiarchaeota archaeon]